MKTSRYEIFKDINGNRRVNSGHVNKLCEAIERRNLLPYFPVLVNEKYEVIDGQHRLAAAIKLNTDIHYEIVPGLAIEDVMQINISSKSWAIGDFIDSWIVLGKSDYMVLRRYIDKYGINPTVAAGILQGYMKFRTCFKISDVIKRGDFKVVSEEYAIKIAEQLTQLKRYTEDFNPTKDREFVAALMRLNANSEFKFDHLCNKLKYADQKIIKRDSEKYYVILLEELYNYHNSKNFTELYKSSYERDHARI